MPLVHWIMQNLQPLSEGILVDGVALAQRLINKIADGGVEVAGDAENIIIKFKEGVEIDGFAPVSLVQNYVFSGGVEVDGAAFIEMTKDLKEKVAYLPGDICYLGNCPQPYTVLGFYYDLNSEIKYEIANSSNSSLFVYNNDLSRTNESYLLSQLELANQMIATLST